MAKKRLFQRWVPLMLTGTLVVSISFAQDEPPLPEGLDEGHSPSVEKPALPSGLFPRETEDLEEPTLPSGLTPAETESTEEPALPEGLIEKPETSEARETERHLPRFPFEISGFWDTRLGFRTQDDPHQKDVSIGMCADTNWLPMGTADSGKVRQASTP